MAVAEPLEEVVPVPDADSVVEAVGVSPVVTEAVTEGVSVTLVVAVPDPEPLAEGVPVVEPLEEAVTVEDGVPVVVAVGVSPVVTEIVTEGVTLELSVAVTEDDPVGVEVAVVVFCARERPRIAKRTRTTTRAMIGEEKKDHHSQAPKGIFRKKGTNHSNRFYHIRSLCWSFKEF